MKCVVLTREIYGGCNCSCFEADEVFGPFSSEEEAEKWARKKFGLRWSSFVIKPIFDKRGLPLP